MNTFLRIFYLVIFSFILSSEARVYAAASSAPANAGRVVSSREEIQNLLNDMDGLFIESCSDVVNQPQLRKQSYNTHLSLRNQKWSDFEIRLMNLLRTDSTIMALDTFCISRKGDKAKNSLLTFVTGYGLCEVVKFLIEHRRVDLTDNNLISNCFNVFSVLNRLIAGMSNKLIVINDKTLYEQYIQAYLEEIRTWKLNFDNNLKLFHKDSINFNGFILKEAFLLRLKYKFNDDRIDKELSSFYQSLLLYYPLDNKTNNFLNLFFEIINHPLQKYINNCDKNLYFYETFYVIGKELVLTKLKLFKEDKDFTKYKGLLFNLVQFGCFEQIDELVKSQDDFTSLVDVHDLLSVFSHLTELDLLKTKGLFSEESFFVVRKATCRFFSYVFDVGFYAPFLFFDKEKEMFDILMKNAHLGGLYLIHRAVRGGNVEAVKFLLDLDSKQINLETNANHLVKNSSTPGLTPICFIKDIQDPVKQVEVIAVFKDYCEKTKRSLTDAEKINLGAPLVQLFEKGSREKRSSELNLAWRQMAEKRTEKGMQDKLSDLKQVASLHQKAKKEKQALCQEEKEKQQDTLKQNESHARNTQQRDFAQQLLPIYTSAVDQEEAIKRAALERNLLSGHTNLLQQHEQLRLKQAEFLNRTRLENEEALLIAPLAAPFYVGQASSREQVRDVTERFASYQAASPSKGKVLSAASSSSSLKSLGLPDQGFEVELALTPRGQSKVQYILGVDGMAKEQAKCVSLSSETLRSLEQLGQAEQNPWGSPAFVTQAIPCDLRVESMRSATIRVDKEFMQKLKDGNSDQLDHAMSTDFIGKVIQCGSVYGQLRKNKQGVWVFNVLIVAAIQEMNYSGQFKQFENSAKKQWVTLGFEVSVVVGDSILLGDVYHFCVQETHPRFVRDENRTLKYLLAPLDGISGYFENRVLKLQCNGGALRGVKGLLERLLQDGQKAYEEYWDSLK